VRQEEEPEEKQKRLTWLISVPIGYLSGRLFFQRPMGSPVLLRVQR
jgi:hypothetical protein